MKDMLGPNTVPAIAAFVAVALAVLAMAMGWEWWRERQRSRDITRRLAGMGPKGENPSDLFPDLFREQRLAEAQWMEPILARLPHTRDLQHLLHQADLSWRAGTFLLVTLGAAASLGLAGFVATNLWIVGLGAAAFGSSVPYMWVRRKKTKRLRAFEEHFPEAIDLLGRAIRAGHAFSTGLQMVADEATEPVAAEFRQVFEEQKFGLPLEDSMLGLADRIDLLDMRLFVTALLIQREVGGNLAEVLDKIAYVIRERFTIQRQVRVYTAQGRFTGYLLAGLPIAVGLLIYALNQEYMRILITHPTGRMMITLAALLQVIGYFIIRKIINIEI
jgi:tight adherence protein B